MKHFITPKIEYLERGFSIPKDIWIGMTKENEEQEEMPFYLKEKYRSCHTYICGLSGSGKSRFLAWIST